MRRDSSLFLRDDEVSVILEACEGVACEVLSLVACLCSVTGLPHGRGRV